MANSKEAIAIVLDVGKSMHYDKNCPSVIEEAKKCICMIIQRKIFSESKDEIALILFGISHPLNESSDGERDEFSEIAIARNLLPPDWKFLDYVKEIEGTSISTDYIRHDALFSAITLLQDATDKKKFTSRRILFMSNFDGFLENADEISEELKKNSIDLNVIGPDAFPIEEIKPEPHMESADEKLNLPKPENAITKILYEVNGESYSFSDVLFALTYYQTKKKRPFPWNANLEVGSLIIPITAFLKVTEWKTEPWKKAYAFNPNAKIEPRYAHHINDEAQTEISKDNLIAAYKFGTTLVPFSEEDKQNMDYKVEEKGLKILGFAKSKDVRRYHFVGNSTSYVFGRKNDECAGTRLSALVHALNESRMVAIVRYQYSPKTSPKIGFLSPKIKENYEYLIFVTLPFMEDLRHFVFPSLDFDPKNIPTEEQLDAIDELINAMDLTVPSFEEEEEMLKPKNTVNPYLQRFFQCLEYRALNPEKPLPPIEPHIEALINPSDKLLKLAKEPIKKIASLFSLKEAEMKQSGKRKHKFLDGQSEEPPKKQSVNDDSNLEKKFVPETNLFDAVTDKITEVGSINPVRDFQYLVKNKVLPFNDICDQLMNVVFKFLKDNAQLRMYHSKIVAICKEFRHASLKENNCDKYNVFMSNLKNVLLESDESLWDKIKNEKIGLISDVELSSSAVSSEQAEMFLASPSLADDKASAIESFEMNEEGDYDDDLLDQL